MRPFRNIESCEKWLQEKVHELIALFSQGRFLINCRSISNVVTRENGVLIKIQTKMIARKVSKIWIELDIDMSFKNQINYVLTILKALMF